MHDPTAFVPSVESTEIAGPWAQAVVRFNLDPVDYADPSWLPVWAPQASARVRRELSRGLLRDQGLEALHDWALTEPAARLFMMDRRALDRVGLAVGIAAHRDGLRRVVRRENLAALRECFGDASPALWLGVAETVPRADLPFALTWEPFDAAGLVARLTLAGKAQMLRTLDPHDPARRAAALRAAFCLPRESAVDLPAGQPGHHAALPPVSQRASSKATALQPPLPAAPAARMAAAIAADLVTRLAPEWTWLF